MSVIHFIFDISQMPEVIEMLHRMGFNHSRELARESLDYLDLTFRITHLGNTVQNVFCSTELKFYYIEELK